MTDRQMTNRMIAHPTWCRLSDCDVAPPGSDVRHISSPTEMVFDTGGRRVQVFLLRHDEHFADGTHRVGEVEIQMQLQDLESLTRSGDPIEAETTMSALEAELMAAALVDYAARARRANPGAD